MNLFGLEGKVAMVTGAARGIGQALAIGLAEAGADVFLVDRIDCSETLLQIETLHRKASFKQMDLSNLNPLKATEIIREAITAFGSIDVLVNNAGLIRRKQTTKFTSKDWEQVIDVNLNAVFYLSQAMASYLVDHQKTGKIINTASVLSYQGGLMVPSYAASKHGVIGLTKALSNEWAQYGINVNAIAPGYYMTEVTAGIRTDPDRSRAMLSRIPAGRWGEPDDLKGPVVFLASEGSNYMHGAVVTVDGGWLAR